MSEILLRRYRNWCNDFSKESNINTVIRINTLKTDAKKLSKLMSVKGVKIEKIDYLQDGYVVDFDKKFSLSSTPEYLQGQFYIQDAVSQIPAEALDPKKGEIVLDMCAAPGGKTTQLSQLMENEGAIVALDTKHERIEALKNNIQRMGCKNIVVYNKDAKYASDLNLKFDKILLDAPCSGNFCLETDWLSKRTLSEFIEKSKTQKQLLRSAFSVLKKGGILVYSTCSLEKEEDEDVIEWAIDELGFEILPVNISIGDDGLTEKTRNCKRFWPHKTNTQGFFVAKLKKIID